MCFRILRGRTCDHMPACADTCGPLPFLATFGPNCHGYRTLGTAASQRLHHAGVEPEREHVAARALAMVVIELVDGAGWGGVGQLRRQDESQERVVSRFRLDDCTDPADLRALIGGKREQGRKLGHRGDQR